MIGSPPAVPDPSRKGAEMSDLTGPQKVLAQSDLVREIAGRHRQDPVKNRQCVCGRWWPCDSALLLEVIEHVASL